MSSCVTKAMNRPKRLDIHHLHLHHHHIFLLLLLLAWRPRDSAHAATPQDVARLLRDVTAPSPAPRPRLNQSHAVTVDVDVRLNAILALHQVRP